MSIELPVATINRRDMTEKMLKATLNPNKQRDSQPFGLSVKVFLDGASRLRPIAVGSILGKCESRNCL